MGKALSRLEPVPHPDRVTGEQRREGRMGVDFLPRKPQSPLLPPDEVCFKQRHHFANQLLFRDLCVAYLAGNLEALR